MNTLQHTLIDLRVLIITLQQLTDDDARGVKEQIPGLLAGLQRTLDELQSIATEFPGMQHTASNGSVQSNGELSIDAPPSARARKAGDAGRYKIAERESRLYRERAQSLMADLLQAEESERRRLADDLHDGLSQTIALTLIKLAAVRQSIGGKLTQAVDEIAELIVEINRETRSISFELSPLVLHDLGLVPAVEWLVENLRSRYNIEIVLEDDGKPKPADERTGLILFRSIRELLINAAKHAEAHHVHVCLRSEDELLNAMVEDDGVGMEPGAAVAKGSGLFSIQERMAHVGGSMRIQSTPGMGTKIRLCAPVTNGEATKGRLKT
jgi:signal transduction histidine kinase